MAWRYLAVVIGALVAMPAVAEWRQEDSALQRIYTKGTLRKDYQVWYGVSVNDLGGGKIIGQSDSLVIGSDFNSRTPFGWYSYQTNDEGPFNYESPRDVIRMFNDFRSATISNTASMDDIDTPVGSLDAAWFTATKDGEERACAVWRGYKNGNRTLITGYLCAPRGDKLKIETLTTVLQSVDLK